MGILIASVDQNPWGDFTVQYTFSIDVYRMLSVFSPQLWVLS